MNKTETTESFPPTKNAKNSLPTSSTPLPGIKILLQIPTKTIGSSFDNHNDPNTSEKFPYRENLCALTSHQIQIHNNATIPFSLFKGTQRNKWRKSTFRLLPTIGVAKKQ